MKFIIPFLIPLFVYAEMLDYFVTEQKVLGETKNIYYKDSLYSLDDKTLYLSKLEYNNKTNFKYERFSISTEFSLIKNNRGIDTPLYYTSFNKQNKNDYTIQKLYVTYIIIDSDIDFIISYGVIPFTGGNFKQYSYQDEVSGNGLFTLVDVSLLGTWFKVSTDNFSVIIGKGTWEHDNFYHNYNTPDNLSGSGGLFVSSEYTLEQEKYKHLFQVDYYNEDAYKNNKNVLNVQTIGVGYSIESFQYATVFYTIISENMINFEQNIKPKDYGGSMLFGIKKYFDIFTQEINIGYEYFKTSEHFFSANLGSAYDNDYGFVFGGRSETHKVYTDFVINKDLIFNLNFVTKSYDNYIYDTETSVQTGVSYKF